MPGHKSACGDRSLSRATASSSGSPASKGSSPARPRPPFSSVNAGRHTAVLFSVSKARNVCRARCNCDFDVPAEMPSIVGDLLVPVALHVVQHEDRPRAVGQLRDGRIAGPSPGRAGSARAPASSRGPARRRRGTGRAGHAERAEPLDDDVHRQPVQPRPEGRLAAERPELLPARTKTSCVSSSAASGPAMRRARSSTRGTWARYTRSKAAVSPLAARTTSSTGMELDGKAAGRVGTRTGAGAGRTREWPWPLPGSLRAFRGA